MSEHCSSDGGVDAAALETKLEAIEERIKARKMHLDQQTFPCLHCKQRRSYLYYLKDESMRKEGSALRGAIYEEILRQGDHIICRPCREGDTRVARWCVKCCERVPAEQFRRAEDESCQLHGRPDKDMMLPCSGARCNGQMMPAHFFSRQEREVHSKMTGKMVCMVCEDKSGMVFPHSVVACSVCKNKYAMDGFPPDLLPRVLDLLKGANPATKVRCTTCNVCETPGCDRQCEAPAYGRPLPTKCDGCNRKKSKTCEVEKSFSAYDQHKGGAYRDTCRDCEDLSKCERCRKLINKLRWSVFDMNNANCRSLSSHTTGATTNT